MKIKALSALLVMAFAAGSVAQAGVKEVIGRVSGGLLGGVLCNELGIGGGNGRVAAVALCAVGGSMIGGEIGRDMDEADAQAFEESQRRSFEGDLNQDYDWDGRRYGSHTGVRGRMRPIGEGYHRHTREVCREYQSVTYRGNRSSTKRSVVCRRSDGSFYSLDERTLYVNGRVVQHESRENYGDDSYGPPSHRRRPPPPVYDDGYDRHDGRRAESRYCANMDVRDLVYGQVVDTRSGYRGIFLGRGRSRGTVIVRVNGYDQRFYIDDIAVVGCRIGHMQ